LSLPHKAKDRLGLYLFAHNQGHIAEKIASHFEAVRLRIEDLIELHKAHACAFVEAEKHLQNHDFRKAEKFIESFGKSRFSDLDYSRVESQLKNLQSQFDQFKNLESRIEERLQQGRYKETSKKIDQLRMLINKTNSELGRESLVILGRIETRFSEANQRRRKLNSALAASMAIILAIIFFGAYSMKQDELEAAEADVKAKREVAEAKAKAEREAAEAKAKAEREAAEAKAKAEREAAEAKAKAEEAYKNFSGSRAGEESVMEIAPGVKMAFCWCPPGEFIMGSPSSEADRGSDEAQVKVTLSKGFWMGKTEVTQAQWQALMGKNPSHFKGANLPVESVSWNDAQEFLKKIDEVLAATDGWKTMLPTEAQWEYAARAGESWLYSGSDKLDEVAWYGDNSSDKTNSVGMKKANAWGLHDMSGNVTEWCRDWYGEKLPGGTDPQGAASGSFRVSRGGSWDNYAYNSRVAYRYYYFIPTYASVNIGFRVLRSSGP
jgi:formylglycine-generating enzyme required for sulfatase activity